MFRLFRLFSYQIVKYISIAFPSPFVSLPELLPVQIRVLVPKTWLAVVNLGVFPFQRDT